VQIGYIMKTRGIDSSFLISIAVGTGALFAALGAYATRFMLRIPAFLTLAIGMLMLGVGIIITASSETYNFILMGAWIQQIGGGIMLPVAINFAVSGVPQLLRGRMSGAWWFFYFVASFSCPLVISFAVKVTDDIFAGTRLIGFGGLSACLVLIVIYFLTRNRTTAAAQS
jgi:MFS family permease